MVMVAILDFYFQMLGTNKNKCETTVTFYIAYFKVKIEKHYTFLCHSLVENSEICLRLEA